MHLFNSAASGIRAQQIAIDTVADNMANINTIGFKTSQVSFAETIKNIDRPVMVTLPIGATVPDAYSVGQGVSVNAVGTDFSQGPISTTENIWDLSIEGEGFFQVTSPNADTAYTRAGSFSTDANGRLQDSQGNLMAVRIPQQTTNLSINENGQISGNYLGEQRIFGNVQQSVANNQALYIPTGPYSIDDTGRLVDANGVIPPTVILVPKDATMVTVGKNGELNAVVQGKTQSFGQITLAGFTNQEGLSRIGNNLYTSSVNSGDIEIGFPGQNKGKVLSKSLEQSNVNLGEAMTQLIQAQRAYQLNSRMFQDGERMWDIANTIRR